MTTFNFTPLYRNTVGFNRIVEKAQRAQVQQRKSDFQASDFPRFDIMQTDENSYQIVLALAGFALEDIDITVSVDKLVIASHKHVQSGEGKAPTQKFIHQGIKLSDFKREFSLAEHVQVRDAEMQQGLLTINLFREVPEALKPRKVAIGSGTKAQYMN